MFFKREFSFIITENRIKGTIFCSFVWKSQGICLICWKVFVSGIVLIIASEHQLEPLIWHCKFGYNLKRFENLFRVIHLNGHNYVYYVFRCFCSAARLIIAKPLQQSFTHFSLNEGKWFMILPLTYSIVYRRISDIEYALFCFCFLDLWTLDIMAVMAH